MKLSCCFGFAAATVLMAQFVYQAATASAATDGGGEDTHGSHVAIDSAPSAVVDRSVVRVRCRCSRPCQLALDVVVSTSTDAGAELVVFEKRWRSEGHTSPRTYRVRLAFPPSLVYRRGFFNRHVLDARSVVVRAWLVHSNDSSEPGGSYRHSGARAHRALRAVSPCQRPSRPPTACPSWAAELMWQLAGDVVRQCPNGTGAVDLLAFPYASTAEQFGVIRKLHPFVDKHLENERLHAVKHPRVTLSVWIYLLKWCHTNRCGIIQHVDRKHQYDSILILLTDTGGVIIQGRLTSGEDVAFLVHVALPLRTWVRLDCYVQDSEVKLESTWNNQSHVITFGFRDSLHYDDTDGYFVIGGGKYIQGIYGYFGPIQYYRLGTKKVNNPFSPEKMLKNLNKAHHDCKQIKTLAVAFSQAVIKSNRAFNKGGCNPYYVTLWRKFSERKSKQTWDWKSQRKFSETFHYMQTQEEALRTGSFGAHFLGHLRERLFEHVANGMFSEDHAEIRISPSLKALLEASCCLGDQRAPLLLAVVHLAGLGYGVDQQQGHVYSLMGALGDSRLALMHMGYKHTQGIDGFPKDLDMAYGYYANMARQTVTDEETSHRSQQYLVEHIYLSNKEDLKGLGDEGRDVVDFLKLKAENGDIQSQKQLATISFWGQRGVSKDIASAVKWYRRSAVQMKDPTALFDYAIVLMKGLGVKKNMTAGFKLLEKAVSLGSVRAVNALGWYHGAVLKNSSAAVKYFKQAALNGSADAMFNLGVHHLNGDHPDSPQKNEAAAFQCFLNASKSGHTGASVGLAWYLSRGGLRGVRRDVEGAVIKLKKVSEKNGHLGYVLRKAFKAYLRGSRGEALVGYILAAETGLGLAQLNSAHLCEELKLNSECQWRYNNYSVLNYQPHPSGLLKMGDYYYSLSRVGEAVTMYHRAASAGSPQGVYNLAVLAQEGHFLPRGVQGSFNVSARDVSDVLVEKLLQRCVAMEDQRTVTPCSFALLWVRLEKAWRKMNQNRLQLSLAYAAVVSLLIASVVAPMQIFLDISEGRSPSRSHGGPWRSAGVPPGGDGAQKLRQMSDLAVSVSGVCACALCTTLFYHLL